MRKKVPWSVAQVCVVGAVPITAFDVEIEVAGGLEGDVGRGVARGCPVPMPGSWRIADDVARMDNVHAVRVGDDADTLDKDEVLTVAMLMGNGPGAGAEMHR